MKINALGTDISVIDSNGNFKDNYISLTDLAKYKDANDPRIVISNWMSSYSTIDFLSTWESFYNPNFNRMEFQTVRSEPGRLIMTPKQWIERMNAIGIISQAGRYGGTYAHPDIAFEFASWISPEFKLYVIKDYQRLKADEAHRLEIGWDTKRELSKINYRIHTDAIKEFLITPELTQQEKGYKYATEADILNVALFGKRAKDWHDDNPNKKGNIRDYASTLELAILSNIEFQNAKLIEQGLNKKERLLLLNEEANREKELFNKNKEKVIYKLENK